MNDNNNAQPSFNFGRYCQSLLHYWWIFVLSFIVCFGCAFLFLRMKAPKTLVVASLLIDDQNPMAGVISGGTKTGSSSALKSIMGGGSANVYNEIMVLESESLGAKTVGDLGINRSYYLKTGFLKKEDLYNNSPIEVNAPKELFDTLSISMKFTIKVHENGTADISVKKGMFKTLADVENAKLPTTVKTPYGIYSVQPTQFYIPKREYKITAVVMGNSLRAQALMKDMTVDLFAKKTDGIYLDVTETNIDRGRDILNTLIKNYNERDLKTQEDDGMHTANFIDDRLSLIYKDLMGSEAEIESYKKAHNIIDAEVQAKTMVGKESQTENAVVALETQYRIAKMVSDFINNPANKNSLIPFEADTASAGPIRTYNNLLTQRMRLETSATDGNQVMKKLDEQIAVVRTTIKRSVAAALRSIQIRLERAQSMNNKANGEMSDVPTAEREMRSLYRDQTIQNEIYLFLLQKREENALRVSAAKPKGKVVDAAYAQSEPVSPKKPLVFFVAFFLALGLPIGIIYLMKLFNNKFATKDELEALTKLPVIGNIQHNKGEDELVTTACASSKIAELFRYVRGNVQFMLPENDDKVVLVTSSINGEGKTFIAANVASSFALLGKKVALVDLNIRNPKVAEMMNVTDSTGLTNYLSSSEISLFDFVQHSKDVEGLDIYVSGTVPPNPAELLQGSRAEQLFGELRSQYDVIVVDSAPVEVVSDTFSLTKWTDMTIYTTRAEFTTRGNVNTLNQLVAEGKLNNVGVVINDTQGKQEGSLGYGKDDKKNA